MNSGQRQGFIVVTRKVVTGISPTVVVVTAVVVIDVDVV
jgi:hypothetical protein